LTNFSYFQSESEDLGVLLEILQGVVKKNKEKFVSILETLIKMVLEKFASDYQREPEIVSAIILSIFSIAKLMPSLIPAALNLMMEKLTSDVVIANINVYTWISNLNKRDYIPITERQNERNEEVIDYENYFKNSHLKNVVPLLVKDIVQYCIFQQPEMYVKIVKFLTSFQTSQNQKSEVPAIQNFVSSLQTMLLKDTYYKRIDNKYLLGDKEEPMSEFLKAIDSKNLEITNYWSFLFFLNYSETSSCSQYLELIFTRDYQVAELIFWIHSCYNFSILNRIVM